MLITNGGDSLDRLEKNNIKYIIFKSLKSKNFISLASNIRSLKNVLAEHSIQIVHTHHRYSELLAVQTARMTSDRKFKTVFTALSLVNKKFRVEYKSDSIIAVSNTVKKMLTEKFRVKPGKINVINNFTDTEEIHELEIFSEHKSHGEYFNLLAIGRFHHEKNFEVLLRALNILKDDKIKLILIGEGSKDIDYNKYIRRHKLNAEIVTPKRDLLEYFLIADVCILPSSKDPFPNFMLQSGLHKKPFIGTNVDGIGEMIEDGHNGLLFESGNETELSEKIHLFRVNRELAKTCSENLYSDVVNNYTQEFIVPKIENVYKSLVQS